MRLGAFVAVPRLLPYDEEAKLAFNQQESGSFGGVPAYFVLNGSVISEVEAGVGI
jgi:hypothetical protein